MESAITYQKHLSSDRNPVLRNVLAVILLALWIPVVIHKLFHFEVYGNGMLRHSLPDGMLRILTWLLPALELAVIGLLVWPKTLRYGFSLSALLLAGYAGYIGLGLWTGWVTFECFCSRLFNSMPWHGHFWFSLAFLAVSAGGLILPSNRNIQRGRRIRDAAAEGGSA